MPPKYADGTFRPRGLSFEYRFIYEGKQLSVYGKSHAECWNKRTDIIAGKTAKQNHVIYIYFKDWFYEWTKTFKNLDINDTNNKSTRYLYIDILNHFQIYKIKDIDALLIKKYLNSLSGTGNKQYKISLIIKDCFLSAFQNKILKTNPAEYIKAKSPEIEGYKVLNFEQQEQMLHTFKERKYYLIYRILSCTGMRIGELLALDFNDRTYVNYQDNYIFVNKSIDKEKGGTKSPKTKKSKRYIPFTDELTPLLQEYGTIQRKYDIQCCTSLF